jgi:hypothetical protein
VEVDGQQTAVGRHSSSGTGHWYCSRSSAAKQYPIGAHLLNLAWEGSGPRQGRAGATWLGEGMGWGGGGRTGLPLPDAEGYAAGYASGQRRAAGSSRGGGAARIAGEQKRVLRDDSRAPGYTEWLETCSDPQSDGRHREQSGSNGLQVNGRRGPATRAGNEPSFRLVKIGCGPLFLSGP